MFADNRTAKYERRALSHLVLRLRNYDVRVELVSLADSGARFVICTSKVQFHVKLMLVDCGFSPVSPVASPSYSVINCSVDGKALKCTVDSYTWSQLLTSKGSFR